MKFWKIVVFVLIIAVSAASQTSVFYNGSFEDAVKEAGKSAKDLLIVFHSDG